MKSYFKKGLESYRRFGGTIRHITISDITRRCFSAFLITTMVCPQVRGDTTTTLGTVNNALDAAMPVVGIGLQAKYGRNVGSPNDLAQGFGALQALCPDLANHPSFGAVGPRGTANQVNQSVQSFLNSIAGGKGASGGAVDCSQVPEDFDPSDINLEKCSDPDYAAKRREYINQVEVMAINCSASQSPQNPIGPPGGDPFGTCMSNQERKLSEKMQLEMDRLNQGRKMREQMMEGNELVIQQASETLEKMGEIEKDLDETSFSSVLSKSSALEKMPQQIVNAKKGLIAELTQRCADSLPMPGFYQYVKGRKVQVSVNQFMLAILKNGSGQYRQSQERNRREKENLGSLEAFTIATNFKGGKSSDRNAVFGSAESLLGQGNGPQDGQVGINPNSFIAKYADLASSSPYRESNFDSLSSSVPSQYRNSYKKGLERCRDIAINEANSRYATAGGMMNEYVHQATADEGEKLIKERNKVLAQAEKLKTLGILSAGAQNLPTSSTCQDKLNPYDKMACARESVQDVQKSIAALRDGPAIIKFPPKDIQCQGLAACKTAIEARKTELKSSNLAMKQKNDRMNEEFKNQIRQENQQLLGAVEALKKGRMAYMAMLAQAHGLEAPSMSGNEQTDGEQNFSKVIGSFFKTPDYSKFFMDLQTKNQNDANAKKEALANAKAWKSILGKITNAADPVLLCQQSLSDACAQKRKELRSDLPTKTTVEDGGRVTITQPAISANELINAFTEEKATVDKICARVTNQTAQKYQSMDFGVGAATTSGNGKEVGR